MIKHIVMYKLKDDSAEAKEKLKETFLSMKGKIDCLLDLDAGVNVVESDRSYDVALVCTFAGLFELEEYRNHPVHVPVMQYVKSAVKVSRSVDYEY